MKQKRLEVTDESTGEVLPAITAKSLCLAFAKKWMVTEKYAGCKYFYQARDFVEAKRLLELNEITEKDVEERVNEYLKDSWWGELRHPAYGLFLQFNKFMPIIPRVHQVKKNGSLIDCSSCGHTHGAEEACSVGNVISGNPDLYRIGGAK